MQNIQKLCENIACLRMWCNIVNYADCLHSLIRRGCMSVSVYNLNYKSSRLLHEVRTEYFDDLKSGLYGLSQKKKKKNLMFQRGDLTESRLVS